MIGTLAVFLPLFFVLIVLCAVVPDRGICVWAASRSVGGQVVNIFVYGGGIGCGWCCVRSGSRQCLSLFSAGLDLLVSCVFCGFSLWTVGVVQLVGLLFLCRLSFWLVLFRVLGGRLCQFFLWTVCTALGLLSLDAVAWESLRSSGFLLGCSTVC